MKKVFSCLLVVCLIINLVISGCGNNSGTASSGVNNQPQGGIKMKINWPLAKSTRYIPSITNTIKVSITGDGLSEVYVKNFTRPDEGNEIEDTFYLPVGEKTTEIEALDSYGNILAHRICNFTITSGQIGILTAVLGVTITDTGMVPDMITVPSGTSLLWVNNSSLSRRIVDRGGTFDSGNIAPGGSWSYTFESNGQYYDYQDNSDSALAGRVIVRDNGWVGLKWSYTTGSTIYGTPALGQDGTVYFYSGTSSINNLYALNANGKLKWTYNTHESVQINSSPAVGSDGKIYLGDDCLFVLTANGSLCGRYIPEHFIRYTPAIASNGNIYASSDEGVLYALSSGASLLWEYANSRSDASIGSDGSLYFGSFHKLCAITSSGSLKWTYTTGNTVYSPPAIGSDGTLYFGSMDDRLYALNSDGSIKWSYATGGGITSSPVIGDNDIIYFKSTDQNLYALNSNGSLRWNKKIGSGSTPAIGADGTIYAGSDKLYALSSDGNIEWTYSTGYAVGIPTIGPDGTIYFCSNGYLYAFYGASGLADSPWPMYRKNPQHTGRY